MEHLVLLDQQDILLVVVVARGLQVQALEGQEVLVVVDKVILFLVMVQEFQAQQTQGVVVLVVDLQEMHQEMQLEVLEHQEAVEIIILELFQEEQEIHLLQVLLKEIMVVLEETVLTGLEEVEEQDAQVQLAMVEMGPT